MEETSGADAGTKRDESAERGSTEPGSVPDADDVSDADDAGDVDDADDAEPVVLPESLLSRYRKFSLYNSPYPAHDRACAVDLYPGTDVARSPVAGEVVDTRTVRCPDRPYAVDHDHLIVVDTGDHLARVLHVDPAVESGDVVGVGDPLGDLVRSGFFGQWVDNHVHLEFRGRDRDPYRASGSLPLVADVPVEGLPWDGTGTVVETGPTHAVLDAPTRDSGPAGPGGDVSADGFAAVADDDGVPLDGGLTHYSGGGVPGRVRADVAGGRDAVDRADATDCDDSTAAANGAGRDGTVRLLGTPVGTRAGRHVDWADVAVLANGERVTGLSLFAGRGSVGAKLVTRPDVGDPTFGVGDDVEVRIVPDDDPVRLG